MGKQRKVLLIGIDGCRPDALANAETPVLDGLIRTGAFSDTAQTGRHTISAPGWTDLLTGVWFEKHGVFDNSFEGANYDTYPHMFRRLKQARPELRTASIVNWEPINGMIVRDADIAIAVEPDEPVAERAAELLAGDPVDLTFIQLDEVNSSGHKHGFDPNAEGYLAAINRTDTLIGRVLDAARARSAFENEEWLVIVTTDHGGSERSHGRDIPEHRTIFIIANGIGVPVDKLENVNIVDIAPTVVQFLGISVEPHWDLDGRSFLSGRPSAD